MYVFEWMFQCSFSLWHCFSCPITAVLIVGRRWSWSSANQRERERVLSRIGQIYSCHYCYDCHLLAGGLALLFFSLALQSLSLLSLSLFPFPSCWVSIVSPIAMSSIIIIASLIICALAIVYLPIDICNGPSEGRRNATVQGERERESELDDSEQWHKDCTAEGVANCHWHWCWTQRRPKDSSAYAKCIMHSLLPVIDQGHYLAAIAAYWSVYPVCHLLFKLSRHLPSQL